MAPRESNHRRRFRPAVIGVLLASWAGMNRLFSSGAASVPVVYAAAHAAQIEVGLTDPELRELARLLRKVEGKDGSADFEAPAPHALRADAQRTSESAKFALRA
jgi:hypothetical protein